MEFLYIAKMYTHRPKEFQQLYQHCFNRHDICFQGMKSYIFSTNNIINAM